MRSKRSCSASASVSRTASGWSAKRWAMAAGVAMHVAVVAAAQRLGGLQRACGGAAATKASWSSARRAVRGRARCRVATQRHPQAPRQRGQLAVAGAVVARKGRCSSTRRFSRPEGLEQAPQRGLVVHAVARRSRSGTPGPRRVAARPPGAPRARRRRPVGVRDRDAWAQREQPAEVAPAARVAHQQRRGGARRRDRSRRRGSRCSPWARATWASSIEPRHRVVVGQRQRSIAQLQRARHQLLGQRDPVQEGVGRVAVQLARRAGCSGERSAPVSAGEPASAVQVVEDDQVAPVGARPPPSSAGAAGARSTSGPPPARTRAALDGPAVDSRLGRCRSRRRAAARAAGRGEICSVARR